MSGSAQTEPKTSTPQAAASSDPTPAGAEGPSEASFNEQGLSFTTTDLSLVEMTEIEYTQLQHILYSHMEAQANEGEMEARLNSTFFSASNPTNLPQYQSSNNANQASYSASNTGNQAVHPVICQSALAPEGGFMGSNQCLGHIDFQELRMMLLSESNVPVNAANQVNKTPNSSSGDATGHNVIRVKNCENSGLNKENVATENLAPTSEPRSKSAVRVRLEDRFNSIQSEIPRCQEPQESGVTLNNLVTLIRHPSELMGVPLHHQQNKCTTLVKNKAAAATTALQFTYPLFTTNTCSTSGNGIPSQTQTNSSGSVFQSAGNPCPILEATKHQELALPRTFSFSYQQEIESTKQTLGSRNKTLPEQVWIKVGEALCKQAVNKRSRSRIRQLDANLERRVLSDIQNVGDGQSSGTTQGATWQSTQAQSSQQGGSSQRRERHNRMERDRRRRIRICCDELNLLVPFCNAETDKATTLQWTTAFLKYIHERHGDSLKKEFESVFCGKTGRRLKVSRSDSVTCPVQENMQSSLAMEKK
ncbi:transcription factor-like 5 protein isoform X1 [Rhinatrema bivittatum]|uniref:transcription factor-like 5 protein isoform X1 n=1 Tax=Rhinatrema bivittatum TaxID=194408 RepID=UPI001125DB94|nr:transcription factor-like 5 protein isoform X1 [Rhinatrema bivittatum]